ncbi:unnamed protein product [Vitrella brassicaformis CCMP3155]|uniref:Uncharacterized protein n=1 Tax=Vitrella brassicaformis (strain CCMP3155) TaxID=1169540 RepID=A0A0G4EDR1_VITBC|nr:unnamed protein product [Vitrella brassicaformis CCMP3155]|eukprot:CEL93513.1 unnamed protein product [Vitrella brassicaformis CCMP3155]
MPARQRTRSSGGGGSHPSLVQKTVNLDAGIPTIDCLALNLKETKPQATRMTEVLQLARLLPLELPAQIPPSALGGGEEADSLLDSLLAYRLSVEDRLRKDIEEPHPVSTDEEDFDYFKCDQRGDRPRTEDQMKKEALQEEWEKLVQSYFKTIKKLRQICPPPPHIKAGGSNKRAAALVCGGGPAEHTRSKKRRLCAATVDGDETDEDGESEGEGKPGEQQQQQPPQQPAQVIVVYILYSDGDCLHCNAPQTNRRRKDAHKSSAAGAPDASDENKKQKADKKEKKSTKEGERASGVWDRVEPPMSEGPTLGQGGRKVSKRQQRQVHNNALSHTPTPPLIPWSLFCSFLLLRTQRATGGAGEGTAARRATPRQATVTAVAADLLGVAEVWGALGVGLADRDDTDEDGESEGEGKPGEQQQQQQQPPQQPAQVSFRRDTVIESLSLNLGHLRPNRRG